MKRTLFPRLALKGITQNKKFYLPYFLSSIGMIMMYYIIHSLSRSPYVTGMYHGGDIAMILSFGKFVIGIFALLFLFYINSFLVKRRYKEFGLYNILGMNKRNIAAIVFWESLFVSIGSIISGICLGIIFSKLAELGLLNMAKNKISYGFTVSLEAVGFTALMFGGIFLLLMIKSLIAVVKTKPLELMQSSAYGEKPPKGNWFLAVIGVAVIGVAYYMALTISNPLQALTRFFIAVILVIIGTYFVFISASVVLCRLLQKNKKYYYKKNHFISVSSMAYRMKRNGAGLASIAILSTMVLVMLSSTGSLYFGTDEALRTRYPLDNEISLQVTSIDDLNDKNINKVKKVYESVYEKYGVRASEVLDYRYATITGTLNKNEFDFKPQYNVLTAEYSKARTLFFITQSDFNKQMGTNYRLKEDEALVCALRCKFGEETLKIGDIDFKIKSWLNDFIEIGEANSVVTPSIMLVISDYDVLRPIDSVIIDDERALVSRYHYSYNIDLPENKAVEIYNEQTDLLHKTVASKNGYGYYGGCLAAEKQDFFSTFGGMFFLGIILSAVFIFAAAIIIYYKQISEGYEDQKRFEIMQNVGMTKKDIKSNINSQILTVFFAPLAAAGLHLIFAFPFLWKILQMFNLKNLPFIILITVIEFVIFGLFYAVIYKLTARAYFGIVSKDQNN